MEAAKRLSVGLSTLDALIRDQGLPVVRVGSAVRIPLRELDEWAAAQVQRAESAVGAE